MQGLLSGSREDIKKAQQLIQKAEQCLSESNVEVKPKASMRAANTAGSTESEPRDPDGNLNLASEEHVSRPPASTLRPVKAEPFGGWDQRGLQSDDSASVKGRGRNTQQRRYQSWSPTKTRGGGSAKYAQLRRGKGKSKLLNQLRGDTKYIHQKMRQVRKKQKEIDDREAVLLKKKVRLEHEENIFRRQQELFSMKSMKAPPVDKWLDRERSRLDRMRRQLAVVRGLSNEEREQVVAHTIAMVEDGEVKVRNHKFLPLLECIAACPTGTQLEKILAKYPSRNVQQVLDEIQRILEENDDIIEIEYNKERVEEAERKVAHSREQLEMWKKSLEARQDDLRDKLHLLEDERLQVRRRAEEDKAMVVKQKEDIAMEKRMLAYEEDLLLRDKEKNEADKNRMYWERADLKQKHKELDEQRKKLGEAKARFRKAMAALKEQTEALQCQEKALKQREACVSQQEASLRASRVLNDEIAEKNQKRSRELARKKCELDDHTQTLLGKFKDLERMQRAGEAKIQREWGNVESEKARVTRDRAAVRGEREEVNLLKSVNQRNQRELDKEKEEYQLLKRIQERAIKEKTESLDNRSTRLRMKGRDLSNIRDDLSVQRKALGSKESKLSEKDRLLNSMEARLGRERSKIRKGKSYLESGARDLEAAKRELERVREREMGVIGDLKNDLRKQGMDAARIRREKSKIVREWSNIVDQNDRLLAKKEELSQRTRNVNLVRSKLASQVDKLEEFRDDLSIKRKALLGEKDRTLRDRIDNEIEREWLSRRKDQIDLEKKLGDAAAEVRNIRLEIDERDRNKTRTPGARTRGYSGDSSVLSSPLTAATTTTGGSLLEYRARW